METSNMLDKNVMAIALEYRSNAAKGIKLGIQPRMYVNSLQAMARTLRAVDMLREADEIERMLEMLQEAVIRKRYLHESGEELGAMLDKLAEP